MDTVIPKRIIQIWGGGDMPQIAKACAANVKLLNPDFEYLFFNDNSMSNFLEKHFSEYKSIFNSYRYPIQKYDLFRYLAVYHFGGFYFDLDMLFSEKLSELLGQSCVLTFEKISINNYLRRNYDMDWDIGNYAFGAAPRHPFIKKVIKNCYRAQVEPEWVEPIVKSTPWLFRKDAHILCTTGPLLMSTTYAENPELHSMVSILTPKDMYDRENWYKFGKYGMHLMSSTWRKKRRKLYRVIRNHFYLKIENKNIKIGQLNGKHKFSKLKIAP